jgi:hypothetical protein
MWDLWWLKRQWDRFCPSTLVSPANSHSTNSSTLTVIRDLYIRRRLRNKWIQSHPTPWITNIGILRVCSSFFIRDYKRISAYFLMFFLFPPSKFICSVRFPPFCFLAFRSGSFPNVTVSCPSTRHSRHAMDRSSPRKRLILTVKK